MQWLEQAVDAVPCDLDADAEEDKGDDAKDSVDCGGRDGVSDLWSVGVAEIDRAAENDGSDEEADVCQDGFSDAGLGGVDAEGEHDDDASGTGGDGEGEGVEGFTLEVG